VGNALSHNFILQSSMYAAKVKGSLGMSKLIASLSWRKVSSKIMEAWSDIWGKRENKAENINKNKTDSYNEIKRARQRQRPRQRPQRTKTVQGGLYTHSLPKSGLG
jgi:hypothetical protein